MIIVADIMVPEEAIMGQEVLMEDMPMEQIAVTIPIPTNLLDGLAMPPIIRLSNE